MAIPNRPLAPASNIGCYGLDTTFLGNPPTINELEPWVRRTLQATRISGPLFGVSLFGFLAAEAASAGV